MGAPLVISVDAMGGDRGPGITVPASLDAMRLDPELKVSLVGRLAAIEPLLGTARKEFGSRLVLRDAPEVVAMDERPQDALRKKKNSSMRIAIDMVKEGEANACVSAGNTGALMAT